MEAARTQRSWRLLAAWRAGPPALRVAGRREDPSGYLALLAVASRCMSCSELAARGTLLPAGLALRAGSIRLEPRCATRTTAPPIGAFRGAPSRRTIALQCGATSRRSRFIQETAYGVASQLALQRWCTRWCNPAHGTREDNATLVNNYARDADAQYCFSIESEVPLLGVLVTARLGFAGV
jgi:hypothetical protein